MSQLLEGLSRAKNKGFPEVTKPALSVKHQAATKSERGGYPKLDAFFEQHEVHSTRQGAVVYWIAHLAVEIESVGSNPGHGEVVFLWAFFSSSFFLLSSLSLTCTGIILNHKVTHSGRDKERKKINPTSAICAANAELQN